MFNCRPPKFRHIGVFCFDVLVEEHRVSEGRLAGSAVVDLKSVVIVLHDDVNIEFAFCTKSLATVLADLVLHVHTLYVTLQE